MYSIQINAALVSIKKQHLEIIIITHVYMIFMQL